MRQLGRIAKCMLAGMTGIIMVLPMPSSGADSGRHSSPLDSRTVPHPEWAQISGQIERTSTAGPNNGDASVRAIIRLSEGGHVAVDFGAAAVSSFRPKMDDFIHVRGEAIEKEGQLIVIARDSVRRRPSFPDTTKGRNSARANRTTRSALPLLLLVNAEER